jgi:hypothetical protein
MLLKNSVWQSSFSNWQSLFIRENLLPLGHTAWQGFLNQGRGMVVCDLANDISSVNWSLDLVEYTAHFLAEAKVTAYLQTLNLSAKLINDLVNIVQNYDLTKEMLLLINENGRISVYLLQNMAISTNSCYQQMQQRRSEFELDVSA